MFICNPTVVAIAWTKLDQPSVRQWSSLNGLYDTYNDPNSPLNNLSNNGQGTDVLVEFAGRHCYRSWAKGRNTNDYIQNILDQRHGSVLEHASVSLAISGISRSCSHELVRHRAGMAWSQESQRYVDAEDIMFVIPPLLRENGYQDALDAFKAQCTQNLESYKKLKNKIKVDTELKKKRLNEAVRSILPNAAETRLVMTSNLRALRHFLEIRGSEGADAEIRRLAITILPVVKNLFPLILEDITLDPSNQFIVSKYPKV